MIAFRHLFNRTQSVVIGMVHLRALPGSPKHNCSLNEITEIACHEADIYKHADVDGIMIENMHDLPWQRPEELGPETVSAMSVVCAEVRRQFPHIPIGVQVLSSGNRQALAIAKSAGLNFIRAEGFVFSHIGDEGPVISCAADLIRYRKHIGAEDVLIFTDVKKKHSSHAVTSDISLSDTAQAAEMFLSDAIVVTGDATGKPADPVHVQAVQKAVRIPTLVGSGVNIDNVTQYLSANAMIIGSHLKMHGQWYNDLDPAQVKQFMSKVIKNRAESDVAEANSAGSMVSSRSGQGLDGSFDGTSQQSDDDLSDDEEEEEDSKDNKKEFKPLSSQGE